LHQTIVALGPNIAAERDCEAREVEAPQNWLYMGTEMEDRCAVIFRATIGGEKGGKKKNDWDRMTSKRFKMEMPQLWTLVYNGYWIVRRILDKIFAYDLRKKR
jgi:hypothetical protein